MGTFLAELEEHLRALDRDILALEKSEGTARSELVDTLFRTVHSLKGASRSVGLHAIEASCHRLEAALAAARDGQRIVDADLIQQLFAAADALKDAGRRLRAGQPLVETSLQPPTPHPQPAARLANEAMESPPLPVPSEDFVRVPSYKLDALLARSSELLTAQHRAADGLAEAASLRNAVQRQQAAWRLADTSLKKLWKAPLAPREGNNAAPLSLPLPRRVIGVLERLGEDLKRLEHDAEQLLARLTTDHRELQQTASALEEELLSVRLVPFGEVCVGLERAARDLARAASKDVEFIVEGGSVEIGRGVLDRLKDPLLHLLRNAVDHGIEPADERRAAGKPSRGTIKITAALRGSTVEIVVADDGRGVDPAAVQEHARRRQIPLPDDGDLMRLLFLPGFSTARFVTEVSGRGMGLDIVKHHVESIHGHVDLSSTPGQGTRVSLTVPVMVATVRALLLTAGGQTFALPFVNVVRLVRADPDDLGSAAGRTVLLTDGPPVPVASLSDVLGIGEDAPRERRGKLPIAVIRSGSRQAALIVDEFQAERELVVKTLGLRLARVRHFSGATLLPTGRIALILNAADLVDTALGRSWPLPALAAAREQPLQRSRRRLLVVDDSVTTRSLEKSILEAAGYEVIAAVDGDEAWRLLQAQGADLVVADVEMPHMDGFALCEAIRGSKRFHDLPVVLVTARETDSDKARGLEVGANAYLPKSTFDQRQLLDVIAQLL